MAKKCKDTMTDKERILMVIVSELASSLQQSKWRGGNVDPIGGVTYTDVEYSCKPNPGDLVVCNSSGRFTPHPYIVGWVQEVRDHAHCLIRELGSNRLCDISNESFTRINGIRQVDLLEGHHYKFYRKVCVLVSRNDNWDYRLRQMTFKGDGTCKASFTPKFGGTAARDQQVVPLWIELKYSKKLPSKKSIMDQLIEGGYGSHVYKYEPRECSLLPSH
jgi:hypothetical protein